MARSRNIKPGFFKNELLAECTPMARLAFAGLWTIADREGRLEYRPRKIRAELFPYDDCDIESMLNELFKHNFILIYEIENNKYIQILRFAEHQNPHHREPESLIPAPEKPRLVQGQALTQPQPSRADSLNPITSSLNPLSIDDEKNDETNLGSTSANPIEQSITDDQPIGLEQTIMFEEVWAKWPAKRRKPASRIAYADAIKRGISHQTIINGIIKFCEYHAEQKTKPQFLQSLNDWLDSDGWMQKNSVNKPNSRSLI